MKLFKNIQSVIDTAKEMVNDVKETVSSNATKTDTIPKVTSFAPVEIPIAGTNYCKKEFTDLFKEFKATIVPRDIYMLDDKTMLASYSDFRDGKKNIYKYNYTDLQCKLEPEPKNTYDRNAIMVMVKCSNWHKLGYIFQEQQAEVKDLLKKGYAPVFVVHGGDCKTATLKEDGHHKVSIVKGDFRYQLEMRK